MRLINGDCIEKMKELDENSVDTIITDPPYGLEFMGKDWDAFPGNEAFQEWTRQWATEALRVAKPGAMMLCFGGTRTFHRIACGIEDAGWEIRDTMMWIYGSGFPKSYNISKGIDKYDATELRRKRNLSFTKWMRSTGITAKEINKATDSFMGSHYLTDGEQPAVATMDMFDKMAHLLPDPPAGIIRLIQERTVESKTFAEREVVGKHEAPAKSIYTQGEGELSGDVDITVPATDPAKLWDGWGTSLKPAWESITVAQKPLDRRSVIWYNIIRILYQITEGICQLKSNARIAEIHSKLSQVEQVEESSIAQWDVVNSINIPDVLSDLTDMLQSEWGTSTNLNIVLSWLNILGDLLEQTNTLTTETATSLTTDLKTLRLLPLGDIFQNTILAKDSPKPGTMPSACSADSLFHAVNVKLVYTPALSVQGNVTSAVESGDLRPNFEPIIVAMKPRDGTFVENALKWGVAGLNIDGGRVGTEQTKTHGKRDGTGNSLEWSKYKSPDGFEGKVNQGRWPANIVHDGQEIGEGAARFFYTAKASKKERNQGLEGMPVVSVNKMGSFGNQEGFDCPDGAHRVGDKGSAKMQNTHPTVKPLSLMTYLARLTATPTGGVVLDPFMGSGTTGMACRKTGRDFIGIELDEHYFEIAQKRIESVKEVELI